MPKETFFNLSPEKTAIMDDILLDTFYDQAISQVKVSQIVDKMGMSRGAFYKYFDDLEDSFRYIIKKKAALIHQDIFTSVTEHKNDFFHGIEMYLVRCSKLSANDDYFKVLHLLTKSDYKRSEKRAPANPESPMLIQWLELLKENNFNITDNDEAMSFLYFVMDLVMNSLDNLMVNQWSTESLIADYRYKIRWITQGIK